MRLLVDTHVLLWWIEGSANLSDSARAAIRDADECLVSIATAWELAIKASIGKLRLGGNVQDYLGRHLPASAFQLLPIGSPHLARLESLPWHHRDPFDRLLIAQAVSDQLTIVTRDPAFSQYPVASLW